MSHGFGFGRVDADAAVAAALDWVPVAAETSWSSGTFAVNQPIPDDTSAGLTYAFEAPAGIALEHVNLTLDIDHTYRGDLDVTLTSPGGTVSRLLKANLGDGGEDIQDWTFDTVHAWGEDSGGTWTVRIEDTYLGADAGTLDSAALTLYGTAADAVAPLLTTAAFEYELGQAVTFDFDEPIDPATLSASDVAVVDLATGEPVDAGGFTAALAAGGQRAVFAYDVAGLGALPDGNYLATLAAGGVADAAGNTLAADATVGFFALAGDANRDRTVNTQDLLILLQNFGTAQTYSGGDANYNGVVNTQDLLTVLQKFGTTLPGDDADGDLLA